MHEVGKRRRDGQCVGHVDEGETARGEELLAAGVTEHPGACLVAVEQATLERLPISGNHVQGEGVFGHDGVHGWISTPSKLASGPASRYPAMVRIRGMTKVREGDPPGREAQPLAVSR